MDNACCQPLAAQRGLALFQGAEPFGTTRGSGGKPRTAPENSSGSWNPEWVRAYTRLEEEFRRRDEQDSASGARLFGMRGSSKDPRGFYATLGVEPSASKQEIQAAYRGLAMKYHPDRVKETEQQVALRKFQAVQEAYATLRDPAKRRQYDAS